MSNRHAEPMSLQAFFAWQERQAERYELVDGCPVRPMDRARDVHADIVVNLVAASRDALRGSGCRPSTGDGGVETRPGRIRRPDVGVDCGRRDPDALTAADPRMVAEIVAALGITLAMSDIHEGVGFPARPRLVSDPETDAVAGPVT